MTDYTRYKVTLSAITPLHIGSGVDLLNDYDYAIRGGYTWRINENTLLDAQDVDDPQIAAQLAQTPPVQLLRAEDFKPGGRYIRYRVQGAPRATGPGAQVKEQIKTVEDQPYIPGTSLKGALRTAIAWNAWAQKGMKPARKDLGRSRQWAGSQYERSIFGKNPNYDFMRALQVGDSNPVSAEQLLLANIRTLNRGGSLTVPIEIEAIRPNTPFTLEMKFDQALYSDWARKNGFHLAGENWLSNLAQAVQAHARQRIKEELSWLQEIRGADALRSFYDRLGRAGLKDNQCILQVGWGTGWEDKTFGSHLKSDPSFMEEILKSPREGGFGLARGRRRQGDPFPKSRRVVVSVARVASGDISETAVRPLGWVLLELNPA